MSTLFGHDRIEEEFRQALHAQTLHHAWLLHGMKGIGKRLLAEKLAGMAVCETQSDCGTCHACRMLAADSHPDIYHVERLEGKRDINIEQVRHVLAFLALSGAESKRRVVVMDDAERMNMQAANALLKGLEEPNEGSLLLIVCADIYRLPATIRSRCMMQSCSPLSDDMVQKTLVELGVADTDLTLAMKLGEGAPGRVACMQNRDVADALQQWQELVENLARIDIGELEAWIRQHVSRVPHGLIVRLLALQVYPYLQRDGDASRYPEKEALQQAMHDCARWPGDVVQRGLRPAPSLLAQILTLRSRLRLLMV